MASRVDNAAAEKTVSEASALSKTVTPKSVGMTAAGEAAVNAAAGNNVSMEPACPTRVMGRNVVTMAAEESAAPVGAARSALPLNAPLQLAMTSSAAMTPAGAVVGRAMGRIRNVSLASAFATDSGVPTSAALLGKFVDRDQRAVCPTALANSVVLMAAPDFAGNARVTQ